MVCYLAEAGAQTYTALLERFKLQTGTLNHHLAMMRPILDQDESKRYFLNRNGLMAYRILMYARGSFAKPELPRVKRGAVISAIRGTPPALAKLVFHPAKALSEAKTQHGPYTVCGAVVATLFFASSYYLGAYAVLRALIGFATTVAFCLAFSKLAYSRRPRLTLLASSVAMAYLPSTVLNLLTVTYAFVEPYILSQSTAPLIENPLYAAITQVFTAVLVWRLVLLFLAVRESCGLSTRRSFVTVFASLLVENAVTLLLELVAIG
jgi:hypothetical protein